MRLAALEDQVEQLGATVCPMHVEQPPPADTVLIDLLNQRDGRRTTVVLTDRRRLDLWNIAWGYDTGDEFAHVTTNCSPFIEGSALDVFFTNEVAQVLDETGNPLHWH